MQASRAARPSVIVGAGWLLLLIHAFPGQMTEASFEYLRQGRSRFFAPENPPALSAMWRWLELVLAGPLPMLLVQSGTFALGAFMLLSRALSPVRAAWATAALLVFPPLLVPLSTIWASSMMTGLLVLGAACLVSERVRVQRGGVALLLLASLAQPHALVAVLPLLVLLTRRIGFALGAWALVALLALLATKHYTKKPSPPIWSYVEPGGVEPQLAVPPRATPDTALTLGVPTRSTSIQDHWTAVHHALDDYTPLFSPWLYLGILIVLVPFALRQPDVLALLVSGATYFVAYLDPIWAVACACIALVIVIARRMQR